MFTGRSGSFIAGVPGSAMMDGFWTAVTLKYIWIVHTGSYSYHKHT